MDEPDQLTDLPAIDYNPLLMANRTITVRMPESVYQMLQSDAHDHYTSLNQYCLTKLVAAISGARVLHSPTAEKSRESWRKRKAELWRDTVRRVNAS